MLMSVAGVCKIELNRKAVICALSVGCLIFLVAASPGWLDIYYKQVSFIVENGTARLLKVYGEFHVLYLIYLVVYFGYHPDKPIGRNSSNILVPFLEPKPCICA